MSELNGAAMSAIYSRGMIANLNIGQWNGSRIDRDLTNEVHANHGMKESAGKYVKQLLPVEFFAPIQKVVSAARAEHIALTLPWLNNGGRILSVKAHDTYTARIAALETEFKSAVQDRANVLPSAIDQARVILNGSFDATVYPTQDGFKRRYSWNVGLFPIPRGADFRVELGDAQCDAIRADIERSSQASLNAAIADVYVRVGKVVSAMVERLQGYKPGSEKERASGAFHASLVENIRDLAGLIPALNIADDSRLTSLSDRLLRELCEHDAKALKDSDNLRIGTAAKAQAILSDISSFM